MVSMVAVKGRGRKSMRVVCLKPKIIPSLQMVP